MKSYTDIEQSKKLAEILPLESADICYVCGNTTLVSPTKYGDTSIEKLYKKHIIPAWSLAALLEVLKPHCERLETHLRADKKYNVFAMKGDFVFRSFDECSEGFDNLVDVYYELILKFKAQKIL